MTNCTNQAPVNFANDGGCNYVHIRGTADSPTWTGFPTAPNEAAGTQVDMEMKGGGASISIGYRSPIFGTTGFYGNNATTGSQLAGIGYVANGIVSNTGYLNWPAISGGGKGIAIGHVPDGTNTGGNQPGLNAFDAQIQRSFASQAATGESAVLLGSENSTADGRFSFIGGSSGAALGNDFLWARSNRQYSGGHQQYFQQALVGTTTADATVRLTADGNAAAANNVFPVQLNGLQAFDLRLIGQQSGMQNWAEFEILNIILSAGSTYASGMTLTVNGSSTFSITKLAGPMAPVAAPSMTIDAMLGAINLSVTGPSSGVVRWHAWLRGIMIA